MSGTKKKSTDTLRDHLSSMKLKLQKNKGNSTSIVADGLIALIGLVNPPTAIALSLTKKANELRTSKSKGGLLQKQLDDIGKELESIPALKNVQTELEIIILLAKQDIIDRIEKYKGRLSRSTWLNQLADVELTRLENEEKQARSS